MKVQVIKKERPLDSFFKVDVATLKHEKFDGSWSEEIIRYNLTRPEAVAVLIYLEDKDKLLLIRQFRYADFQRKESGWIDEIVAGVMEENEDPLECARRETIEETGYEINNFEPIASVYSSPGITTEFVHIYFAKATSKDLKHAGGGLDTEHEDIKVVELSREEAAEYIKNGKIQDAKTIVAIQYFLLHY